MMFAQGTDAIDAIYATDASFRAINATDAINASLIEIHIMQSIICFTFTE